MGSALKKSPGSRWAATADNQNCHFLASVLPWAKEHPWP